MRISTFFYTIRQGIKNIIRNKLFSLASVATIGACLFLFGLFFAVVMNFRNIVRNAQDDISITIFFEPEVSVKRMQEIGTDLSKRVEVSRVVFTSADEAWADYSQEIFGENYEEYAGGYTENPLAGSDNIEMFISDVALQPALVTYLDSLPEVRLINRSDILAEILSGVNSLVAYASIAIIAILLVVSIFLISNTVAIGISVRREEINIMKYIGATDFFVRSPFVIEGILIGIIGSFIPLFMVFFIYEQLLKFIAESFSALSELLTFLPIEVLFQTLIPVSVGMGAGIGLLGSVVTVRKHLRV